MLIILGQVKGKQLLIHLVRFYSPLVGNNFEIESHILLLDVKNNKLLFDTVKLHNVDILCCI